MVVDSNLADSGASDTNHPRIFTVLFFWHLTRTQASQVAQWERIHPPMQGDSGDTGSIPEWARAPRGGCVNPPQGSHLENPTDRGSWWATIHGLPKSQTWLSNRACIPKNTPKEIHRNLNLHTYLSICLSTFLCVHFEKAKVLVTQSCLTLCCILQLSKLRPKRYSPSSCCRSCSARFKQLAWIWVSGDPLSNPNLTPNSLKQDPADLLILSRD